MAKDEERKFRFALGSQLHAGSVGFGYGVQDHHA
jgi:hypothetical protein